MRDDLRTRIAKVLHSRYGKDLGYADHAWDEVDQAAYLADADAVIRELGTYEDTMGTGATRRVRIVSDWEKADE